MRMFGAAINYGFRRCGETGILITVDEILEKRIRHIESFIASEPRRAEAYVGANKVVS